MLDFEKLYALYYMQVYSYVMTLVKNSGLAEELTQKTFVKALSKQKQYKGTSSEYTWLCSIAKNLAMDEFRRLARLTDLPEDEIPAEGTIAEEIEDHDTALRIHMILHTLAEPYKEVFQLRVFGELAFAQIGTIFGKTENWARVTYHRAKLMIQDALREEL